MAVCCLVDDQEQLSVVFATRDYQMNEMYFFDMTRRISRLGSAVTRAKVKHNHDNDDPHFIMHAIHPGQAQKKRHNAGHVSIENNSIDPHPPFHLISVHRITSHPAVRTCPRYL